MDAEFWTILGTGVALAALNLSIFSWLRGDIKGLSVRLDGLAEDHGNLDRRLARIEGRLLGREALEMPGDRGHGAGEVA